MSGTYVGKNPPQNVAFVPEVSVKDNLVLDVITDGVIEEIEFPVDFINDGAYDIIISSNSNDSDVLTLLVDGDTDRSNYKTNYLNSSNGVEPVGGTDVDSYLSQGSDGAIMQCIGSITWNESIDTPTYGYTTWQTKTHSYSAGLPRMSWYSGANVNGSIAPTSLQIVKNLFAGGPITAGIRVIVTRRAIESEKVVYANGQSIQKNYLHNTGNWVNQPQYSYGTPASAVTERLTDRWLANAIGASIAYETIEDIELMTIVGGIYQGLEQNDLSGKVCVLSWEGTSQASLYRINGNANNYQDSPIVFTMPTGLGSGGEMEYVSFGPGTLKHMKLELGEVPTKWEPEDIATQLNICQRYFQRLKHQAGNYAMSAYVQNATTARCILTYETKRVVPSVTLSLASHYIVKLSGVDATVTAVALSVIGLDTSRLDLTCSGGGMISGYGASASSVSDSAYIDVDAEIK